MSDLTVAGHFEWTEERSRAALGLAEGKSKTAVAKECQVSRQTLYDWLAVPEFAEEVDRLTLMTGIASRAERLRIAKRVVSQLAGEQLKKIKTTKDLLEWLKFAQSETDGIKLDLAKLAAALGEDETSLAD